MAFANRMDFWGEIAYYSLLGGKTKTRIARGNVLYCYDNGLLLWSRNTLHGNNMVVTNAVARIVCDKNNRTSQQLHRGHADGIILIYHTYGIHGKRVFSCAVYRVCCAIPAARTITAWRVRIDRILI